MIRREVLVVELLLKQSILYVFMRKRKKRNESERKRLVYGLQKLPVNEPLVMVEHS